jgi:hypothetical protein
LFVFPGALMDAAAWREQPLARGCLGALLFYASVVVVLAGVRLASGSRTDLTEALIPSVIGGVPLTFGLLYWWDIRKIRAEARLVRQALREVPRVDGQRLAVIGTIELEGVALQAPFSGRECAAYWYDVLRPGRTRSRFDHCFFFGWRITPLSVRTPSGDALHLLASFDNPGWELRTEEMDYANAAEYVRTTEFSTAPELGAGTWADLEQLRTQVPPVRADYAKNPPAPDVATLTLRESRLERGAAVCAFGRYSAAREALVADPAAPLFAIDLKAGEPGNVLDGLRSRTTQSLLLGALFTTIGFAVAALAGH